MRCRGRGTYSKEEVADVVGDVHRDADVCKVEAVAEKNEADGDDVVGDQLLEVLAWLFLAQKHDNGLLDPEGGLKQVVKLERGGMSGVWVCFVHPARLEVPKSRGLLHGVQAERGSEGNVARRVHLFHKA